jgi:pyruvate ferredoxin oxidoreductase beta subunit
MAVSLKKLSHKQSLIAPGHRACAGCGSIVAIRQVLMAVEQPVVCTISTGCMEVATTIYPYTSWRVPYMHNAFENSAATCSGIEAAYQSFKRQGKIDKDVKFIAFGGDGGTYDIGLQSLSGAMERGHDMLYVCYNNQAYMNTGIQRSSATPKGASTSTAPAGKAVPGKRQFPKDLTRIMIAHDIPYVAQASPHNPIDLIKKVQKALSIEGPKFINVISSCHRGWRIPPDTSIDIVQQAVECKFWALFEYENGSYKINYKPKKDVPVEEWFKSQRRFAHLFKPENRHIIDEVQQETDKRWAELCKLAGVE